MELKKVDGLGQGKVSSTAHWIVCAKYVLKEVRRSFEESGTDCAFIDDLTQLLATSSALDVYDATKAALATAGGRLNMSKMAVRIPTARNAAERMENEKLKAGFLARGVSPTNILEEDHLETKQQGFELLGVPHGTDAFKTALMEKVVADTRSVGLQVAEMGRSFPAEALLIQTVCVTSQLDFIARNSTPTSSAIKVLATAHKHSLAVVASICGSTRLETPVDDETAVATGDDPLPPFATELCALARRHGGLALRLHHELAQAGILHLAVLASALPLLLVRLTEPGAGQASEDLAKEITNVEHSLLPWAVEARGAYADVVKALAPLSAADSTLLKELLPTEARLDKTVGATPQLPSLGELVTAGFKKPQKCWSRAFSERRLLRLYRTYKDVKHRYMLRTGSAPAATAFLQPLTLGLSDDHRTHTGRMKPHIFRMALRNFLGLEPVPGLLALLVEEQGCCPSCGAGLHSPLLDEWAATQHLISCGDGGWWQRIANGITWALAMCYNDIGVKCKAEVKGLSENSAHRPGDLVSDLIGTPLEFDAGGTEKHAVDTTVTYTSGSARSLSRSLRDEQQWPANRAEKEKVSKMNREIEQGKRTGLPPGYRFIPAGITSRGVMGESMEKLLDWLSDYGVKNRGVLGYLGEEGAQVKAALKKRWTQRISIALHRTTMEAVWFRALDIQDAASRRRGGPMSLTAIDLRLDGGLGLGDEG
jgi:hypothetical protein